MEYQTIGAVKGVAAGEYVDATRPIQGALQAPRFSLGESTLSFDGRNVDTQQYTAVFGKVEVAVQEEEGSECLS